jgi:hypothetical protein
MISTTAAADNFSSAWAIRGVFDMMSARRKSRAVRLTSKVWGPAWALVLAAISSALAVPGPSGAAPASHSQAGWPLFFEPGPVQGNRPANFVARGPGYQLVVEPGEVDFILRQPQLAPARGSVRRDEATSVRSAPPRVVRMIFSGVNSDAAICGAGELEGKVNYLVGKDPARWRAQVATFSSVKVQSLYPGVDLVYYGNHRQLEYDFTVSPRADASAISFRLEGVDKLEVNAAGELVIGLGAAELRQHRPVLYQIVRGVRREIAGGYRLSDARTVCFAVGSYDHDWPLVIDPVFSYATYFGGNGGDTGLAIKVDASGSIYLAGETLSTQFPAAVDKNPVQGQFHGGGVTGDAFVAKLDNTGSKLLYVTYLGGSGDDGAYDLAINSSGNAYITGFTVSSDFPTKNAYRNYISGTEDATFHIFPAEVFVAELNTNGSALVFSTYLGGSGRDVGSAIAVDPVGFIYVSGYTYSSDFPVFNAWRAFLSGNDDAFVAKFAPGGRSLVYSTYLGGSAIDEGEGIAADSAGFAYVAGYTASIDFPLTYGAFQTNLNGSGSAVTVYDAFVTRISPDGSGLVYSTYIGGSQNDFGYRIAVDNSGNAYVTGTTQSPDFPHTNGFNLFFGENGTNAINFDAFLTKINPAGKPVYSAQFGGTDNDAGWDVAVDPAGRAFVIGTTLSTNFPVSKPFDLFRITNSGARDVFVVAFETNEAPVLYSAYLGGSADDFGYAIAADAESNVYISGMTLSGGFPTKAGHFQGTLSGSSDAFISKIRLFDPILTVEETGQVFRLAWPATAPDYVLESTPGLVAPQVWTPVPQTPILTDRTYFTSSAATNNSALFRLSRH